MSSRVIKGGQAGPVRPMAWRRVAMEGAGGTASGGQAPAWAPSDGGEREALEARLRELEAELGRREEAAYRRGLEEGAAAEREKLAAPLKEAAGRLAAQVRELTGLRTRVRREAEEDLVRLAVAIARRILRRELNTDPAALLGLVKAALERVEAREVLRLRVSPENVSMVEGALGEIEMPARFEVVADAGLEPGAVVLETVRGDLDASVSTQLAEIERGLTDLIRRRGT